MTAQEAAKRNERSQGLKVWQVDETWFYAESDEGKICYKVCISDNGNYCSCGDFAKGSKNDPNFACKHVLAVYNSIPKGEVEQTQFLEKRKPKVDERFIKVIDEKEFVIYNGLLDMAHQKNLYRMEVEIIQFPSKENDHTAICKAMANTTNGSIFTDIGDANPMNCNHKVAKHLIRMASTRAKARCLRDLTNIGMTALEELGDISEVIGNEEGKPIQKDNVRKFTRQKKEAQPGNGDGKRVESVQVKETAGDLKTDQKTKIPVKDSQDSTKNVKSPDVKASEKSTDKGNGKSKESKIPMMSGAQKNAIYNLSRRRGISVEEMDDLVMKSYNVTLENLSSADASQFIRTLQQSA
jgi:hypothetical protein